MHATTTGNTDLKVSFLPDTRATTSMKACAAVFADVGNVSSFDAITSASASRVSSSYLARATTTIPSMCLQRAACLANVT